MRGKRYTFYKFAHRDSGDCFGYGCYAVQGTFKLLKIKSKKPENKLGRS